jgi:hypothetical protein
MGSKTPLHLSEVAAAGRGVETGKLVRFNDWHVWHCVFNGLRGIRARWRKRLGGQGTVFRMGTLVRLGERGLALILLPSSH